MKNLSLKSALTFLKIILVTSIDFENFVFIDFEI